MYPLAFTSYSMTGRRIKKEEGVQVGKRAEGETETETETEIEGWGERNREREKERELKLKNFILQGLYFQSKI